ncbi:ricin-type beta-trefoil lectin domain protein [Streptomyces sp. NPDC086023]|uniref:ricin-type beta-trefoil lectin domain protein n=1 Tax=Streptomyces sp. NPDC086023 TaxID=3365746 RepID=UPI0037CD3E67
MSALLMVTLLPGTSWAAGPGDRSGLQLPGLDQVDPAKLDQAEAAKLEGWAGVPAQPPAEYEPVEVTPPPAGSADVALSGGSLVQAGSLPVALGKASPTEAEPTPPDPSGTWSVAIEARAATEAAGVDGAIIKITPPVQGSTPVDVQLDYEKFEDLYGTEWSSRLELKQLPECFLTTPELPECSQPQEIPSTNDPGTNTVRATVDPATAPSQGMSTMSGGSPVVLTASDSGSGAGGTYTATSLSPSGTWTAGGSGGGFAWSYPLGVPSAPAGPSPQITFSYSSQSVDGRTSIANGQGSWIGDGWGYEPGFIERRYRSCSQDRKHTQGTPNNDNGTDKKKSDLCWAADNVVMSLNGTSTELVHDAATGNWIPASDDGSRVERKTDAANGNGAKDGEYWVVTTRDGTRYHFGRHNVGGHVGTDGQTRTTTDSVFTVPVVGNHPGEPCHASTYAASFCNQGWRWNLDYVEDVHGNAMVVDWFKERNRYAQNGKVKEKVPYVRGGYPTQIIYGLRADNLGGAPAAKVEFTLDERCIEAGQTACTDARFESRNYADKQPWWDTPATLHCKEAPGDCYVSSPTFWTRKRLTAVTTYAQRTEGSTALSKVDKWTLTQSFPKQRTDTHPPLWLESISRTGYATQNDSAGNQKTIALPPVSFLPNVKDMPNRVAKSATDPTPDFDRLRVETVRTETGGDIYVDYSDPCPVGTTHPKPEENKTRCFPVHWSPDPDLETPPLEWFNKYVVDRIVEKDRVARQPDVITSYTYDDAAWGKDTDEFSRPELRTYNQWRGYASVTTRRGATENTGRPDAAEQSQSKVRYFRGMSGDGGRPKAVVMDSTGTQELGEDLPSHQGRAAETIVYTKAGGDIASRELTWPWSEKTATRNREGTTPLEAFRTGTARTEVYTSVSGGRTYLNRTRNTFDPTYGLLLTTQTEALTSNGTGWTAQDEKCAVNTYVHNTGKHLIGLPQRVRSTAGDCTKTETGTVLADARTSYDALNAFGTAPVKGLPFQVDTLDGAGTGWITTSRTEYDPLGRVLKVYDAAGNTKSTSYTPATGAVFSTTVTNALGHTATAKVDPGRGSALEATDANGRKVTQTYDALGRVTQVWTASQNPATDAAAHVFDYQVTDHEPPAVTSRTLRDNGTYEDAVAIYDGLLRPRQNQTEAVGGGRLVVDTLYGSNGQVRHVNNSYHAEGEPDTKVFVPETVFHVPSSTQTAYDGMGRVVRSTNLYSDEAQAPFSTTTEYGGDYVLTRTAMSTGTTPTPLQGSRAVKVTSDVLGRKVKMQHALTTATPMTWRDTTYAYDVRGNLSEVTDAAGNDWTYTYDARGRLLSSQDPDMGTGTFGYDNLDRVVWTGNATGEKTFTYYDKLGRKTSQVEDDWNGPLLATWSYDTLPNAKGYPVAATRHTGGIAVTSEVTGYDSEYRATGTKLTIPDAPQTKGVSGVYVYGNTYTKTGRVQTTSLPATPGGLAAERLVNRYSGDGGQITMSGLAWYTADTVYSPFGQVLRTASGNAPQRVWTTNFYNRNTGRLRETIADRETANPNRVNALSYDYDVLGNINSITDTQPGGKVDRQCFGYDPLGQLTQAWTGKTCSGPVKDDVTAGPDGDGYRHTYAFDAIGNRTKLTVHDLVDPALDDEYTYSYGVAATGGAQPPVVTKPHALSKVDAVTRDPGNSVTLQSTFGYDERGNTTRRTIGGDTQTLEWDRRNKLTRAVSPGVGAFAVTGLAGKCLDVESGQTADGTPVQLSSCNLSKAQQWRFTGNAVKALDKCLTNQSGAVRLATCDGGTAQKFVHRPADQTLYHPTTGQCVDVPGGNSADGTDLILYACNGGPNQKWSFGDTTTYVYDADGNRLIQETGSSRTLYLGEAEVTVDKAGQAVDAVRYYSSEGAPTTLRRTFGKSTGHKLTVSLGDHHGTVTTVIDQAPGQAVTRRKFDPYGNTRGPAKNDWSFAGKRTFLGVGTDDGSTGLTHIGAREYDASTGRFISVDPIMDITDPLQMNGYTYSNGDPVNQSDPTGLESCYPNYCSGSNGTYGDYDPAKDPKAVADGYGGGGGGGGGKTTGNSTGGTGVKVEKSGNSIKVNGTYVPTHEELMKQFHWARGVSYESALMTWTRAQCTGAPIPRPGDAMSFCTAAGQMGWMGTTPDIDALEVLGVRDAYECGVHQDGGACKDAVVDLAIDVGISAVTFGAGKVGKILFKGLKASIKGGKGGVPVQCLIDMVNSFPAGTHVQMADGTTKPIEELQTGDVVLTTDPETGLTEAQPVAAVIVTDTDKQYVELTLDAESADSSVVTTAHHPFWSESDQAWKDAADLTPGTTLRTPEGTTVTLKATRAFETEQRTYNLTVASLHTYYVLAAETPVLVHNSGPRCHKHGGASGSPSGPGLVAGNAPKKAVDMLNMVNSRSGGIGKVPGYNGNENWGNNLSQLPGGKYKEWDVNAISDLPVCSEAGCTNKIRGAERLLTPKDGPGPAYYTPDHYGTFYYVGEFTG